MPGRNLNIAYGQVAAAAAQIATSPGDDAARVNITFCNVGGNEETVILTISANGGTARRVRRVVLGIDEQFEICGLALNHTDSLLAVTSNASSVDYVVSIAPDQSPFSFASYDSNGQPKTVPYLLEQMDGIFN